MQIRSPEPQQASAGRSLRSIETDADIAEGLAALAAGDPRLLPVIERAGTVPLRRSEPGFRGLANIIVAQQISKAAAASIWNRFESGLGTVSPEAVLGVTDDALRECGLSRPKIRTLRAIAGACHDGFDLDHLATLPAQDAIRAMTTLHGIGPWTAEVYLLFCLGHADIFPAGDLALVVAIGDAFGHADRPSERAVREIASAWSPWRGVAARLFWSYYAATRREAAPV